VLEARSIFGERPWQSDEANQPAAPTGSQPRDFRIPQTRLPTGSRIIG